MRFPILLGLLALFSTSPIINCFQRQLIFPLHQTPWPAAVPVVVPHTGFGSTFAFLVSALAAIAFVALFRPPAECPLGYVLYSTNCGRFCYRFNSKNCQSWTDARTACKADGGDLWAPDECSYEFFQQHAKGNPEACNDFWIGASSEGPGIPFQTVRGVTVFNDFKFWSQGEPSIAPDDTGADQLCAQMSDKLSYLMSDEVCTDRAGFICQIVK